MCCLKDQTCRLSNLRRRYLATLPNGTYDGSMLLFGWQELQLGFKNGLHILMTTWTASTQVAEVETYVQPSRQRWSAGWSGREIWRIVAAYLTTPRV